MADETNTVTPDAGAGGGVPSAAAFQQWVDAAQKHLAAGGKLDNGGVWDPKRGRYGMPLGYEVHDGKLQKDANVWGSIWPGLVGMALVGVGGAFLAPSTSAIAPVATTTTTGAATLPTIPTTAGLTGAEFGGTASTVLPSATIPAASTVLPSIPTTAGLTGAEFGGDAATTALPTAADTSGLVAGSGINSTHPSYLDAIKEAAKTATDLETGRANGRKTEAELTNAANLTDISLYRSQIDSNNAQNRYGLDAAGQANDFATKAYGLDLDTSNAANRFGLDKVNAGIGVGNLDLAQKRYGLEAPGARAGNAVRGDILANAQDASFNLPSTIPKMSISGGLRPSMFSPATRQLGSEISAQALDQQRKGDAFAPLPTLPDYMGPTSKLPTYKAPAPYVNPPAPPKLTPQPQANAGDTALNIAGYAGLIAPYLKYFV